jgi:hypothetical protein
MTDLRPRTEAELVELLRASDVRAPERLHRRIESMVAARSAARWRVGLSVLAGPYGARGTSFARRLGAVGALATVVAAVLVIALAGGGGGSLSLQQATALTLASPKAPPPLESTSNRSQLMMAVQGVHFPYWEEHFGWRSTGQRTDHVGGRTVTTVFYANRRGQQIGYAIVAGTPAPRMTGGVLTWNRYRVFTVQGAHVITWKRSGRLCVLSGRGVDRATLLRLASWGEGGARA